MCIYINFYLYKCGLSLAYIKKLTKMKKFTKNDFLFCILCLLHLHHQEISEMPNPIEISEMPNPVENSEMPNPVEIYATTCHKVIRAFKIAADTLVRCLTNLDAFVAPNAYPSTTEEWRIYANLTEDDLKAIKEYKILEALYLSARKVYEEADTNVQRL